MDHTTSLVSRVSGVLKTDSGRVTVISLFYLVGIVGHLIPGTRPLMLTLTPGFLGLFGLLVSLPSFWSGKGRFALWLGLTYLVTFTAEALGVATGLVFGSYHYGPVLGPMIFEVPVVIGFNWTLVTLGALQLAAKLPLKGVETKAWFTIPFTALVCTVFDWIMEPLAMGLEYWTWAGDVVPIQNYGAWAVLAALGAGLFKLLKIPAGGSLAAGYLAIQTVFFLALRFGGLGKGF